MSQPDGANNNEWRAPVAQRRCKACATPLAGQVAYFDSYHYKTPLCGACALEAGYRRYVEYPFRGELLTKDEWLAAGAKLSTGRPCEVCGHEVAWLGWRYARIHVCSHDCATERLNRRRRVEHESKVCPVCHESFTPTRSDARTCSDRCRQRLRRARLAAAAT